MNLMRLDPFGTIQPPELDQDRDAHEFATQLLDHLDAGFQRAAGGDEVVDHQDPLARLDRIGVDLERVVSVFQFVVLGHRVAGKLALLANGNEAGIECPCQRGSEDEATGFGPDDQIDIGIPERIDQ